MITVPYISQLPQPASTLVMLALLIAAFYVAFKVMEMVMETVLVSVLSGAFYLSLVYFFNYSFSLETMIFYSFAGASLYMSYSFLVSAYGIAAKVIEIPYRIVMAVVTPLFKLAKSAVGNLKSYEFESSRKSNAKEASKKETGEEQGETKEVVLDKVKED